VAIGPSKSLEPPANTAPLAADGSFTQPWANFFGALADMLRQTVPGAPGAPGAPGVPGLSAGNAVIMQTGTSTSDDASGAISVTLPVPYAVRTLSFVCDASPAEPAAFFNSGTVQTLPLDVITGTLSKDNGSGTIVAVPNAPFTWFSTGV